MTFVDYNETTQELLITFSGNRTYTFYDVPQDVYLNFLNAPSKGKFFNTEIKDRYRKSN